MLRELEIARDQINLGVKLATMGNDEKVDPLETNDLLIKETERITSLTDVSRPQSNVDLIKANTDRMEAASQTNGITGISTGFHDLDQVYGGRQNTDLSSARRLAWANRASVRRGVTWPSAEVTTLRSFRWKWAWTTMQRLILHTEIPFKPLVGRLTSRVVRYNAEVTGLMLMMFTRDQLAHRCKKWQCVNGRGVHRLFAIDRS